MPLWVRVKLIPMILDIADSADTGNRESRAKVLSTGTNDWVSFGKLFL